MTDSLVRTTPQPVVAPPTPGRLRTGLRLGFWPRLAAVVALTATAYFFVFADIVAGAVGDSRTAYLLVVPVWAVTIAVGYRSLTRGVGDNEADWILAALIGGVGFTAILLTIHRIPTAAGLWHLHYLGIVVWAGCAAMILFGIRHVVRMWALWAFLLCCATPLPYLLVVARFGGTDTAAALTAVALAAVAVFLAGRTEPLHWRLGAVLVYLMVAVTGVMWWGEAVALPITVVVAAGVAPVLTTIALLHLRSAAGHRQLPTPATEFPRRSPRSLTALALIALTLLVVNPALQQSDPAPADDDWTHRAGLLPVSSLPFITDFIGPQATLTRYEVPAPAGRPTVAVDVISTPHLATLRDYSDAVWYPSSEPTNYRDPDAGHAYPQQARVIHSNADAATTDAGEHWYAVTWLWRTPVAYQQVTVVVSQTDAPPPLPQPLTLSDDILSPALWIARQQPHDVGDVGGDVVSRAAEVVALLTESAGHQA